jgi:hypothetical protein
MQAMTGTQSTRPRPCCAGAPGAAGRRAPRPHPAARAPSRRRGAPPPAAAGASAGATAAADAAPAASTSGRGGAPPGPEGAFQPGQEAAARQQLFNRIAPVYDEVGGFWGVIGSPSGSCTAA